MAQPALVPNTEEVSLPVTCRHHWVIQSAEGPESQGECQVCGEVRRFKNYVDGGKWGDTRLNPQTNESNIFSKASAVMSEEEDFDAAE
jgi:hypothetical protein